MANIKIIVFGYVDLCFSILQWIFTFLRTILSIFLHFQTRRIVDIDVLTYILSNLNLFVAVILVCFHVGPILASQKLITAGKNVKI